MSEIEEFQRRIAAALDRIGQGLEGRAGGAEADEVAALRQQLEDERLASAQLEERLRKLKARQEAAQAEADASREATAKQLAKMDTDLQALRQANRQLRDNNAALREANAQGVADPHLINKAMMAELEALRASRATDRAEAEVILSELGRVLDEADGGEETRTEEA
jgi:predicted  nucleic acid-binding Zn-ribbon protein